MIEPPSLKSGSAFWTVKNSPFTFTSKVWSKWASVAAASGAIVPAPAFAKRMSMWPCFSFTTAKSRSRSSKRDTSPTTVVTFPAMRAAASLSSFSRRPVITTCAPSSTKRLAVANQIPLLPPVMTATLPSSFFLVFYPWVCVGQGGDRAGSELSQPAVDGDLAGGHEAAVRRREKGGRSRDLRRIGHALERSHRAVGLLARLAQSCLREFGRRRPGRQHVHPDAGALQVLCPGPREVAHCRFARAVGGERRGACGAGARPGQDDRTARAHQRQRLLDREDRTLHIDVERFVDVLGGDLAELKLASHPGIGEDDVEGSALGLHRRVEPVEVGQVGNRALHRAGIGPEFCHSGVERFLPAA